MQRTTFRPTNLKARLATALIVLVVALTTLKPAAAPNYSGWGTPVNLGPVVNSPFTENGPHESKDGLSLYFGSDRSGGAGNLDIWVSRRASVTDPWGFPVNVEAVNTSSIENVPSLSRDSHWLFFNTNRPGGEGGVDIWVAWRANIHDDLGWDTPRPLGRPVNSPAFDGAAHLFQNDDSGIPVLFFTSARTGTSSNDTWVSEQFGDGSFGPPQPVSELNTVFNESHPSIRFDGLEIFFFSNRPGSTLFDIWTSTRDTVFDPWEAPSRVGAPVSTAFNDIQPHIAVDRETLFLASDRPGTLGLADLYVAIRTKKAGNQ